MLYHSLQSLLSDIGCQNNLVLATVEAFAAEDLLKD
jgi:hypothetical protein